ncbi:MAG: T9SS type A sorting domain-containing protein [Chlorobiales bacterium]|nr:T9SS type A sorting domain-containing protein [Chlorobiales bacterium]
MCHFTPTESLIELALGDTYLKDDPAHNDNPLPVELTAFNGASTSAGIKLNWTTQSETDNAGFVLLRNGQEVASHTNTTALKGQGTKSGVTNYTYTDMEAELGLTYTYKLRSVDLSGQTHDYPRTVSVKMTEAVPGKTYNYDLSQNYPNPFNPSTTILYQMKEAGIAKLVVYDVLGREVVSRALQANKGWNEYKFNAASLGSGVYFYRLSVGGQFDKTMKMMLMK